MRMSGAVSVAVLLILVGCNDNDDDRATVVASDGVDEPGVAFAAATPGLSEWGIAFCAATIDQMTGGSEPTYLAEGEHPGEPFADAAQAQADALREYGEAIEAIGTPPTETLRETVPDLVDAARSYADLIEGYVDDFDAIGPDSPAGGDDAVQAIQGEISDTPIDFPEAWDAVLQSEELGIGGGSITRIEEAGPEPEPSDRHQIATSPECLELVAAFIG